LPAIHEEGQLTGDLIVVPPLPAGAWLDCLDRKRTLAELLRLEDAARSTGKQDTLATELEAVGDLVPDRTP
jgi:hypothetical protein